MSSIFLIAPILFPIIGGFLLIPAAVQDVKKQAIWAEVVALITTVLVWHAIFFCDQTPVTVYSFMEGFSVSFKIDKMAILFAGMVSIMWPVVLLYAYDYVKHDKRTGEFFAFYVMTYGITLGIALSANIVTMYVFFEMLTLITIPLVSHYGNYESMYAGRRYAAFTILGASLGFLAVVLTTIYGNGGFFTYGGILSGEYSPLIMRIAFLFAFFGFGTKSAIFPLHDWLPTASVAPTPVTALLHAVAVVNSGVFAVARCVYFLFGTELLKGSFVQGICIMTAGFSLVFGSVMALKERHFKRRLAYSTMSNLSYMLLGLMFLSPAGLTGGMMHMLFHGVIKMTLFLCAGSFMHMTGYSYIYEICGVGKKMPVTFVCYTLGDLSLTGIPLFCGFLSKWQLIKAAAGDGSAWGIYGVATLFIGAFLCAMYTLSISVRAFFPVNGTDRYTGDCKVHEAGPLMTIPIIFFTVVNIGFGIWGGPITAFITKLAGGM